MTGAPQTGSTLLTGRAHRFGDDISADLHVFDKHTIFSRTPGPETDRQLAQSMLSRLDPDFPARRNPGDFIVAGKNFGTISMYDQSAAIIKLAGIAAVIASSFDDLFVRHAVNRGLLLIECQTSSIATGDELRVDVDRGIVHDVTGSAVLPCRTPHPIVKGWLAEGGVIEHLRRHGDFV